MVIDHLPNQFLAEVRIYVQMNMAGRISREDIKDDTYAIEIADLNNDGLPDIVEANSDA